MTAQHNPYTSHLQYVALADYDASKLTGTPVEQKTVPGTGPTAKPPSPPQSYYRIPLMFNFGSSENKRLDNFLLECCEMESPNGIINQQCTDKPDCKIMVRFDRNNVDHDRFLNVMCKIHEVCACLLAQVKGTIKMYNFNPNIAEATGLKYPVFRPRDDYTGEFIPSKNLTMYFKLNSQHDPTIFTNPSGQPIPWHRLEKATVSFIPLLHVQHIHIGGGRASIKISIISATVTSFYPQNTLVRQLATIVTLRNNPVPLLPGHSVNVKNAEGSTPSLAHLRETPDIVSYREYVSSRLACTPVETKLLNTHQNKYCTIPLLYKYNINNKDVLRSFLLEACQLNSKMGISKYDDFPDARPTIGCQFDLDNPEHTRFIDTINEVYTGCTHILGQMKGNAQMFAFNPRLPEVTGFRSPLYKPRDHITRLELPGAPSIYFKLNAQTLFVDITGRIIPHELLTKTEMTFIPLLHVKSIYVKGFASLQMTIQSAVVTSIKACP